MHPAAGCSSERHRECGASLVEFALLVPALFFVMFAIIELGVMFWVNLTMQHAVREGGRYAVTGQTDLDPDTKNRQRYRAVIQKVKDSSMGLYERVDPAISLNHGTPMRDPARFSPGMFGGPGDIMVLQFDCNWPILTPLLQPFFTDGKYHFSVAATMRNEEFR